MTGWSKLNQARGVNMHLAPATTPLGPYIIVTWTDYLFIMAHQFSYLQMNTSHKVPTKVSDYFLVC